MLDFTNGEFSENMTRIENIISAHKELEQNKIGTSQLRKDVLRASVVFMHSSLEEVVRNLFLLRLPNGSTKNLNKIPFSGHEKNHRPKEILLGHLKNYSGKFVENAIYESINEYIDTMNINGSAQLAECLEMVEIQVEPFRKYFSSLDSLMKRRHQIVHQMDRQNTLDPLQDPITNIEINTIEQWKQDLYNFSTDLIKEINRLHNE